MQVSRGAYGLNVCVVMLCVALLQIRGFLLTFQHFARLGLLLSTSTGTTDDLAV